ncbi:MAG: hypothetical protein GX129_00680 [Clostridiales bacterium]|jgi:hypothetical protein|nr:hypothetical protein [Clostridiales bacterium]
MAKCKLCKKPISDGTEYCNECDVKKDLVSNESYLDDLLNSVQNKTTTAASHIYKKKKEDQSGDSPDIIVPKEKLESPFLDPDDLEGFEKYDFMKEFDDPIVISDEELYGDSVTISESYEISNDEESEDVISQLEPNIDNEFLEINNSDDQSLIEDEHIEPVLDDLLKHLDMVDDNDSPEDMDGPEDSEDTDDISDIGDSFDFVNLDNSSNEEEISAENELLDLLNHFNPDNQGEDDIQAISDLLGGIDASNRLAEEYPEDVGEVFSEALEAVSDLSDSDKGIQYIIPDSDVDDKKASKGKKGKRKKKEEKENKEKKQGLFDKLFANLDDDDISPEKIKAKEEAAAAKEEKKKKRKGKKDQVTDTEEGDELPRKGKQEAEPTEDKKKAKKEKKKKIEILDDYVDDGHINKTGASIVFLFFGVLVILLLISTNIFSYSLSIKNATDYFGRQRYTQAYNEVYGIELKDEDIELYDKIMTVMFVNKQLNSYNNYYHMRKFPEALDSLLKGLQRYDKYIELATMLGIKTDLDYVRDQIVAELYSVFNLTEEQALRIINSESQAKYSIAVYDVILENISFYN